MEGTSPPQLSRTLRMLVTTIMANRMHPPLTDADNPSGSLPAVRSDWRISEADSMSARTKTESPIDAGYTAAGASQTAKLSVNLLPLRGSQYTKGYASDVTK